MHSTQPFTQIPNDLRVQRQCQLAERRQNIGDYEGALAALSGVWGGIGERPRVEKLSADSQAEVLLRVGPFPAGLAALSK